MRLGTGTVVGLDGRGGRWDSGGPPGLNEAAGPRAAVVLHLDQGRFSIRVAW